MTILFLIGKGVGLPLLKTSHFDILIHADLFADGRDQKRAGVGGSLQHN